MHINKLSEGKPIFKYLLIMFNSAKYPGNTLTLDDGCVLHD